MSRQVILMACLAAGMSGPALAADGLWNPFASKQRPATPPVEAPSETTDGSLTDFTWVPKLPTPEIDMLTPLEQLSDGTKQVFRKTKQVLTPPKMPAPKFSPPSFAAWSPFKSKGPQSAQPAKKSFLGGFWQSEPKPPQPMTASEFIGLPRPQ